MVRPGDAWQTGWRAGLAGLGRAAFERPRQRAGEARSDPRHHGNESEGRDHQLREQQRHKAFFETGEHIFRARLAAAHALD